MHNLLHSLGYAIDVSFAGHPRVLFGLLRSRRRPGEQTPNAVEGLGLKPRGVQRAQPRVPKRLSSEPPQPGLAATPHALSMDAKRVAAAVTAHHPLDGLATVALLAPQFSGHPCLAITALDVPPGDVMVEIEVHAGDDDLPDPLNLPRGGCRHQARRDGRRQ